MTSPLRSSKQDCKAPPSQKENPARLGKPRPSLARGKPPPSQILIYEAQHEGFTMDDQRLKEAGGGRYFEELRQRNRDIRSSKLISGGPRITGAELER